MEKQCSWWSRDEVRIVTIRMPARRVKQLKLEALNRQVSLNKLVNELIAEGLKWDVKR